MTVAAATADGAAKPLPRLRRDLSFTLLADVAGEFPSLSIGDSVRGTYYKVSWPHSGLFLLWEEAGTVSDLKNSMLKTYGVAVTDDDVAQAVTFAFLNELSQTDDKGGWQRYANLKAGGRHSLAKTLMHNYLFFRIPLVKPDRALRQALPYVQFAFRSPFWIGVAMVALAGLYLTTRQWSELVAAFNHALQFQGLLVFAVALLALKAVHEFGHAITTVHYGCRVPSMGIAFMLGTPVLYTDTSDSWRLSDHRQRLRIVFAGVAAESIVCALALFLWPLLPDGTVREACFGLATAAIAMSLAVNLNPFMRFDGYFALSDFLKIPNLQARSFELACWHLRECLFGLGEPPPERFPDKTRRCLIAYAYLTWIYRFFLYLGIAILVYVMAGKAFGIVLGLFELVIFILRPIWQEVAHWWKVRARLAASRRTIWTAGATACGAVALCTPWISTIESPAVLVASAEQAIHLPVPARITKLAVTGGQSVEAGQVLFEARSPELDHKLRLANLEARLLELRLSRLLTNEAEFDQTVVLKREYKLAREKIDGVRRQRQELLIKAPFSGKVVDLDTALAPGTWVAPEQMLARVTSETGCRVNALVADAELPRLEKGAPGVFVADQADLRSLVVVLETIAPASDGHLAEPVLADVNGGLVATVASDQTLRPRSGWIETSYAAADAAPSRVVRGVVRVDAKPISPLGVLWQQIGRVFVREQSF